MGVRITNERYSDDEWERFVSGDYNSAGVSQVGDRIWLTIGGMPEIPMTLDRAVDLAAVLLAVIGLAKE